MVGISVFPPDCPPAEQRRRAELDHARWPSARSIEVDELPLPPRERWRKHPTENRIIADASIVLTPTPRDHLVAEIEAAQTVNDLKAILRKMA